MPEPCDRSADDGAQRASGTAAECISKSLCPGSSSAFAALSGSRDIRNWNGGNNAIMKKRAEEVRPYAGEERLATYVNNIRAYIEMLRCLLANASESSQSHCARAWRLPGKSAQQGVPC